MSRVPHLPRFTFKLWLGWILLVMGITWTCVGLGITAFPSEKAGRDAGVMNAVMALCALVLPGLVLVGSARRDRHRVERVHRVAALASVASRLPFGQVAEDLGTDVATARKVLFDAVSFGVLRGPDRPRARRVRLRPAGRGADGRTRRALSRVRRPVGRGRGARPPDDVPVLRRGRRVAALGRRA